MKGKEIKQPVPEFHVGERQPGALISLRGRQLVDFSSWDALGWAVSPDVQRALAAFKAQTLFSQSSRMVSGTCNKHLEFEHNLSRFSDCFQAVSFSSKSQAVLSFCTIWLGEGDVVFYDELMQSPVVDACYLVGARVIPYSASALDSLARELELVAVSAGRVFIFCESLSPLTGVAVDANEVKRLAVKHKATLCIDESFAIGRIGLRGAGVFERTSVDLSPIPWVKFVDLGVALGCFGAVLCGPNDIVGALVSRSRTFVNELALPPLMVALADVALLRLEGSIVRREKLNAFAEKIRLGAQTCGANVDCGSKAPILSLAFDHLSLASEFSEGLFERGFLVEALAVRAPLSDRAIVRILPTVEHSDVQISRLCEAMSDIYPRIGRPVP